MSSAFDDFGPEEDGTATRVEDTSPFDDDGYAGYEEHGGFAAAEEARNNFHEFSGEEPPLGFPIDAVPSSILHHHDLASSPSPFSTAESMAKADDGGIFYSDVSVLPPLSEMPSEEGFLRREWRRQNAVYLEEKERREKELRLQTVEEAEEFKKAFYQKREQTCEANKILNREREKLLLINQENFHAAADKQYWKAISELIPNEIPNIEKKKEQKAQEKKPTITVIQGPKPGKPTDLTRLRQILLKLKHNPPPHMIPPPLLPPAAGQKDSSGDKLNEVAAGA